MKTRQIIPMMAIAFLAFTGHVHTKEIKVTRHFSELIALDPIGSAGRAGSAVCIELSRSQFIALQEEIIKPTDIALHSVSGCKSGFLLTYKKKHILVMHRHIQHLDLKTVRIHVSSDIIHLEFKVRDKNRNDYSIGVLPDKPSVLYCSLSENKEKSQQKGEP